MNPLITLAVLAGLFLAMPWLAIAFRKYCDLVNRLITKRAAPRDGAACRSYQTPTTAADSGLCARCGMCDYKHREQPDA